MLDKRRYWKQAKDAARTGLSQKAPWRVEAVLEALSWTFNATGE